MKKSSFSAKLSINGFADFKEMDFEVVGDGEFYKLVPLYKNNEPPIKELEDVYFNANWGAKNLRHQQIVNWLEVFFKENNLKLPT